ncbi:MAG: Verru_Chthon cassette protein B [Verrucomicrobiales bacterium]|jgi:uncharacterized protein (TIGR02598 family)|nr:Verru_Chthon cassette protein B [Verrucomicrobiales bacterium]
MSSENLSSGNFFPGYFGNFPCPRFLRALLRHSFATSAFTLVEVSLVIGIVAVSVLSSVALMSVGLNATKAATDSVITAQILNKVSSTVQTTPFNELSGFVDSSPLFFDRTGREVSSVGEAFFSATLLPIATSYPGAPSDLSASSVQTLEIVISVLIPGTNSPVSSSRSTIMVPKS